MQHYQVLGTKITSAGIDELHDLILHAVDENLRIHIASGNIHSFNVAYENPVMQAFLNSAEAVRCDGHGVKLGARLLGIKIMNRTTWADWWNLLGEFCQDHDLSMFFLGARPGIAESAGKVIQSQFNRLRIAGMHHGYFEKQGYESEAAVELINNSHPDILIVGMGMPLQETWLNRYREKINVPVVLTGGACLDYLSGAVTRCPPWMSRNGLEWFYRFLLEPRRMFRRYVIGNPLFFFRIIRACLQGNE